jgi:putative Mg2+ transporter-C (MgtC) family protein
MDAPSTLELIGRLAAAGGLGALLGLEREFRFKSAGLRTHTIVALGAALFTIAGAYGVDTDGLDPSRVAAQVVTGIGFIGAGAIMRSGLTVTGLTTAGTLWLAASIGVTAGMGLLVLALVTTALGIVVVMIAGILKPLLGRSGTSQVEIDYYTGHGTLGPVMTLISNAGGEVMRFSLDEGEDHLRHVLVEVTGLDHERLVETLAVIATRDEVVRVSPK